MKRVQTKHAAEAVLRELPSVVGACVREDIHGRPREVHLLVRSVPDVRELARDVRALLEERLEIPIDQRIISIAQLETKPAEPQSTGALAAGPAKAAGASGAASAESRGHAAPTAEGAPSTAASRGIAGTSRLVYDGLETDARDSRISVRVRLSWRGTEYIGESSEVDAGHGRARAAAAAVVRAAAAACGGDTRLELEAASISRALERDYALVSVLAISPWLGRRPVPLVGAHPVEGDVATAAALAVLKATNRVIERSLEGRSSRTTPEPAADPTG